MELTIKDRITLLNFPFPHKTGLLRQFHIRQLIKKIEFSPDEVVEYDLKDNEDGSSVSWDVKKAKSLDVDFSKDELEIISDTVNHLDNAGEITLFNLDTCLKFHKIKI
jgi:hypothetical protein